MTGSLTYVSKEMHTNGPSLETRLSRFHQARWNEPIIFELTNPGQRGIIPPELEDTLKSEVKDAFAGIPESLRRKRPPNLPEIAQPQVLRHYLHLSQETLGADFAIDVGQGTSTMKYSPKVNEQLARSEKITEIHPLQPEETIQGILEIYYRFEQILKQISGMDRFSLQPGAGSLAIYTGASIIRAYHKSRGQHASRDEIITTIFSHPSNAAAPKVAGYKIITLFPEKNGYPSLNAIKSAVSERTAGLFITNPEDTGIYNPKIDECVKVIHDAGGLCYYDQANLNGILGITRAREAGFDLCHFNLHKTFSSPHGSSGPGVGALGVVDELASYLPVPLVAFDGHDYYLDYNVPNTIGKIHPFFGNVPVVIRAYAWVMSLGAEGIRQVSELAVLNNNYLIKKMLEISGVSIPYADNKRRIEQARYSWKELNQETDIHSEQLGSRLADFGTHYWTSHHPYIVPEPCTLEPTESYSKQDIDAYVGLLTHVAEEARKTPEIVRTAPHNCAVHQNVSRAHSDLSNCAITWRAYQRKFRDMNK